MMMEKSSFNKNIESFFKEANALLNKKNSSYSSKNDALHNFIEGVKFGAADTPEKVAYSYLTKHLVSVKDIIFNGGVVGAKNASEESKILFEKFADVVNYFAIIYVILLSKSNEKELKKLNSSLLDCLARNAGDNASKKD